MTAKENDRVPPVNSRVPARIADRFRACLIGIPLLLASCLTGCRSEGGVQQAGLRNTRASGTYSIRRVQTDAGTTYGIAESVLLEYGYQLAVRDRQRGILRSVPLRMEEADSAAPQRARLGTRPPLRRTAEVFLDDDGDHIKVYCQVVLEELATEAYEFHSTDQRTSDLPGATPIDRGAGATREQRDVWRFVRRDRRRERDLLERVQERTSLLVPAESSGSGGDDGSNTSDPS